MTVMWVVVASWAAVSLLVGANLVPEHRSEDGGTLMGTMVAMVSNMPPISVLDPVASLVMMPLPSGVSPPNSIAKEWNGQEARQDVPSPVEVNLQHVAAPFARVEPYGETIINAPHGNPHAEVTQGAWRLPPPQHLAASRDAVIRQDDGFLTEDIVTPAGFNPLEVFLPDHLRSNADADERNQRSAFPLEKGSQETHFRPWPNTGQETLNVDEVDIRQLTQPNTARIQDPAASHLSEETIWPQNGAAQGHNEAVTREQKFFAWPNIAPQIEASASEVHPSTSLPALATREQLSLDNQLSRVFEPQSEVSKVSTLQKLQNTFAATPTEKTIAASQLPTQNNKLPVIVVKSNTTRESSPPKAANNTLSENVRPTTHQPIKNDPETVEYRQPWLHAAVQHDLMRLNLPYDKEALHGSHAQELLRARENDKFQSGSFSEEVPHEEIQTTTTDKHLAIVEVPNTRHNGPVHIKNVHVIAPAPKDVPPVPLFRPAEKKPLEQPPYVVRNADSRNFGSSPGADGEDAMLVVPFPAQRIDPRERSSRVFPVMLPLKRANARQDMSPIDMFMKPIRDIFQLGGPARPGPHFRQQHLQRQQPFPDLLQPPPARETPVVEFDVNNFPGFGPPKGEDVVLRQTDSTAAPTLDSEAIQTQEGPRLQPPPLQNSLESFNPPPLPIQNSAPSFGEIQPQFFAPSEPQSQPQSQPLQVADAPQLNVNEFQGPLLTPPPAFQENGFQPSVPFETFPQNPQFQPTGFQAPTGPVEVFQEQTDFRQNLEAAPAPAPSPPTVNFVRWPNTVPATSALGTEAAAPAAPAPAAAARPPSTSAFNFPSLSNMQLPSLPNMNFLNPFNFLRNREASNPFPRLPSLFSKSDSSTSASTTNEIRAPGAWPNLQAGNQPFPLPSHEMQPPPFQTPPPSDAFFNTLKQVPADRENTFQFMPHLQPIFNNAQKPSPPAQHNLVAQPAHDTHAASLPVIRPHSGINSVSTSSPNSRPFTNTQAPIAPTNKPFNSKYNQSASKFIRPASLHPAASSAVGSDPKVKVINPQTNPARGTDTSSIPKSENLGPALIKFTLDDVLETKKRPSRPVTEPSRAKSEIDDYITPEDDMTLSPSEDVVTVAHIVQPPTTNTPTTLMMERITFKPTVFTAEPKTAGTNQPHKLSKFHQTPQATTSTTTPSVTIDSTTRAESTSTLQKKQLTTTTTSATTVSEQEEPSWKNPSQTQNHQGSRNNATSPPKYNSFFPISWGVSQPADETVSTNIQRNQGLGLNKGLPQAASSRVTIIEATPMPKPGEIFPTLKHFSKFTTPMPEASTQSPITTTRMNIPTTFSSRDPVTPLATSTTTEKNTPFTRPDPLSLITARKRPEVLMPGRWNQRTMNKPPQLEPENFSKEHSIEEETEQHFITHNQSKVRYNPPPRKFFHINRPTPRPALIQKTLPASTTPTTPFINFKPKQPFSVPTPTAVAESEETPTTTPIPEEPEMTTAIFRRRPIINFSRRKPDQRTDERSQQEDEEENENDRTTESTESTITEEPTTTESYFETTTLQYMDTTTDYTSTTPVTTTDSEVSDKPSRYNSILRLRNFMARKRNNRTTTSTTPEPVTTTEELESDAISSIPPTPPSQTKLNNFSNLRTRLSNRPISTLFRRPTPTPPMTTTTAPTTTTKKPSRPEKIPTTFPPKISNFKDIDREHSGSHSSNYEWRQPIQEVLLQDHPEMLHLYNWESSRLDSAQDRVEDFSSQSGLGDIEILFPGASNLSPVTEEVPQIPASQEASNLAASVGRPFLSPEYASVSRNEAKETLKAATHESGSAWEKLMGSLGMGESPYSHILLALHKNDPSILDI